MIVQHHFSKSLLIATSTAGTGWSTPSTAVKARTHNIHVMCDSYIDSTGSRVYYLRAPITPHNIAQSTAYSHTLQTIQFVRRRRLEERGASS